MLHEERFEPDREVSSTHHILRKEWHAHPAIPYSRTDTNTPTCTANNRSDDCACAIHSTETEHCADHYREQHQCSCSECVWQR
jgi:hypothetical protein